VQSSASGNQYDAESGAGDKTGDPRRTLRAMLVRQHELIEEAELARRNLLAEIAERKRTEDALRESEARFRELAEVGPQFIWVSQPDGTLEYVNQRWIGYSGLDLSATSDFRQLARAVHPEDQLEMTACWGKSLATGELFEMEARLRRADGVYRWFMIRSVAATDEPGCVTKWFAVSTDIHEQKQSQEKLRRANRDLEQFAYSASHDLQEPIRNVAVYGELLSKRYGQELDATGKEFLAFMTSGAKRMEMLVKDLLAYAQSASMDGAVAETADATVALEKALSNLVAVIRENDAEISYGTLPSLPVCAVQMQQLFQNLIGNAIKYRKDDERPRVHIMAERSGVQWLFSVRDNGIGIASEYRERVFGIFKRLHSDGKYSGTGMGLAICQRIVEGSGGRIWVESAGAGMGSIFHFTLPAGTAMAAED
jgi:PAS domain S-box-containing protein